MTRLFAARASAIGRALAVTLSALLTGAEASAADYACNFVEVQCDRAANLVRVVPFRAQNEECDRVRAIKDADWLIDVARHVPAAKARNGSAAAKVVQCELADGRSVWTSVHGAPIDASFEGPCGAVFSAVITIEERHPHRRRVVNELNLLQACRAGGAADSIEYLVDAQKVVIQWSSQPQFGSLERTILARKHLKDAARKAR